MRNNNKGRNKVATKKLAPPNYLIICEGKETEPNYFNGLKQKINEKFGDRISVVLAIKIKGTGLNTESLVKYTKQYINKSPKVYGQVWVVIEDLLLEYKKMYAKYKKILGNTYCNKYKDYVCLMPNGELMKP